MPLLLSKANATILAKCLETSTALNHVIPHVSCAFFDFVIAFWPQCIQRIYLSCVKSTNPKSEPPLNRIKYRLQMPFAYVGSFCPSQTLCDIVFVSFLHFLTNPTHVNPSRPKCKNANKVSFDYLSELLPQSWT